MGSTQSTWDRPNHLVLRCLSSLVDQETIEIKMEESKELYKMWGLDGQISDMAGLPPKVDKCFTSSGRKLLRVGADRCGYPGWITPCFLEALSGCLKMGLDSSSELPFFTVNPQFSKFVTTLDNVKDMLAKAEMPMFSIPTSIVKEAADIMETIMGNKKKMKLRYGEESIHEIEVIGGGLTGLLSALFSSKLYDLDHIRIFEKSEEIGGRLSKNYSGGMRFACDDLLLSLLSYLEIEIGSQECVPFKNINEKTLLYTPDKFPSFQTFIGSKSHQDWKNMLDKIYTGFKQFKENHEIHEQMERSMEDFNRHLVQIFSVSKHLQDITLEQFLIEFCNFSDHDLHLSNNFGYGGGPGHLFGGNHFINTISDLQDNRFGASYVLCPRLAHHLVRKLFQDAGIVTKLGVAMNEDTFCIKTDTFTIDARNPQLKFPLPQSWEQFTAPKLCLELRDTYFSGITGHILAEHGDPLVSNIYFIENIALSYVWLRRTKESVNIEALKVSMKASLLRVMKDLKELKEKKQSRDIYDFSKVEASTFVGEEEKHLIMSKA